MVIPCCCLPGVCTASPSLLGHASSWEDLLPQMQSCGLSGAGCVPSTRILNTPLGAGVPWGVPSPTPKCPVISAVPAHPGRGVVAVSLRGAQRTPVCGLPCWGPEWRLAGAVLPPSGGDLPPPHCRWEAVPSVSTALGLAGMAQTCTYVNTEVPGHSLTALLTHLLRV